MARRFQNLFALTALLVASPARTEDLSTDFVAVARSGARPDECGGRSRGRMTRWEQARVPGLSRYCDALARGYSALGRTPERALTAALAADAALPGRAAPVVLAARSEAQLGKYTEAWERFDRARALSPSSVESPGALHDLAVAALRTGHIEQAADAYRVLAPRVELIDDERERVRVLVEGGVLAMRRGPEHLGEAIGYLNEARRAGSPLGLGDYVIAALSLAYARQGRESDAMGVVDESSGPWRLEAEREREGQAGVSSLPALPAGELDAMIAILSERRDKDLALERLQSYLVSVPSGPFAAWTRARREALLHARKAAR